MDKNLKLSILVLAKVHYNIADRVVFVNLIGLHMLIVPLLASTYNLFFYDNTAEWSISKNYI